MVADADDLGRVGRSLRSSDLGAMIVGDPQRFAIEHEIFEAYPDEHFLANGMFVLHIGGLQYGVRRDEATTFGNAVDAVETLIEERGQHVHPRLMSLPALELADTYLAAFFRDLPGIFPESERVNRRAEFLNPRCDWPNQDEEFDDGSHVLVYDSDQGVRVVGFKGVDYQVEELADQLVSADDFYNTIAAWLAVFRRERQNMLKPN